ncbi:MAG: bifunctional diguanylate cyclase/phosphodiesterase [Proteobacteria bacterium]|nr:bifunctional diguanylate cyclase/phosphodiesterase [Pseudomonadota bacterium]
MIEKKETSNIIDLSRSLKQKETEIELLQQTFTEIGSELDLDRVFQIVSDRARELIGAETLLIPLLDDNCETYTYRGGAGKNASEIVGESMPLEFGVCGWVWKQKRPWWQGMLDELSSEEKNRWEKEAGNMILVPLQGKRNFLGGIAGLDKIGGGNFDKKDLNLLQLFASIVSVAIENAMVVQKMETLHELKENYRLHLEKVNKQLIESSEKQEYLSLYDSVTALPNRSLFHDRLSRDISEAQLLEARSAAGQEDAHIGILLIDIDRFKEVNDTHGHEHGDAMLSKIARRFESETGVQETLASLGGDVFIVVLPGHDQQQSLARAERYSQSLKDGFDIKHTSHVVSSSIGIAVYPQHGRTASALLSHADFSMHKAKESNVKIYTYDAAEDHLAQGHLEMIADVRKALDERQFELYYQPKVSAGDCRLIAAEALGRWHSETRGEVPPGIFIELLEKNNLIDEYTYWAIETALSQAKKWRSEKNVLRIAVNLSPRTLMHPEFKTNIDRIIKSRSDGELLTFEITENIFLSEFDRLSEMLGHVCSLGIELSIDDYGTGYSSLSRLSRLPISELKIDQSFIKEMLANKNDEVVVRSTIELAHNLNMNVVAEGVEEQLAMDLLKKLGCDTIQGFLISKPMPAEKFEAFFDM